MLPTVGGVVAMDIVRRGRPRVVAGEQSLDTPVRWVHVSELADIAQLLSGGELVLTTGVALPDEPAQLASYVTDLAEVGASGLCIELGRRYLGELPEALVDAAVLKELPLIVLDREVPFVRVTEAVHSQIIDAQLAELQASEQLHQTFTALSVQGATPETVVSEVARLSGCPTVLENLTHQVLTAAGNELSEQLENWEQRSRKAILTDRTGYEPRADLLVTTVGARDEDWGRLVLVCDEPPAPRHVMLIERAATTLALGRLIERDQNSLLHHAHRTIISSILNHTYSDEELTARAHALGVPLARRQLVGLAIRAREHTRGSVLGGQSQLRTLAEILRRAAHDAGAAALIGSPDEDAMAALVAVPLHIDPDTVLRQVAGTLHQTTRHRLAVGAGSTVASVSEARRSLLEARQVADVARDLFSDQTYYRLSDLGVRGLVHLLWDDTRMQTFVERQLGPLLVYDTRHRDALLPVLAAYLGSGGNKSATAAAARLSRPALYDRLDRIERVLGIHLNDAEQRTSLHLAVLALQASRTGGPLGAPVNQQPSE